MSTLSIVHQTVTVVSRHTLDNATRIYTGDKTIPGIELTLKIDRMEAIELMRTLQDMLLHSDNRPNAHPLVVKLVGVVSQSEMETDGEGVG